MRHSRHASIGRWHEIAHLGSYSIFLSLYTFCFLSRVLHSRTIQYLWEILNSWRHKPLNNVLQQLWNGAMQDRLRSSTSDGFQNPFWQPTLKQFWSGLLIALDPLIPRILDTVHRICLGDQQPCGKAVSDLKSGIWCLDDIATKHRTLRKAPFGIWRLQSTIASSFEWAICK